MDFSVRVSIFFKTKKEASMHMYFNQILNMGLKYI